MTNRRIKKKQAKAGKAETEAEPTPPPAPRFIEIVNWKKAQPRMTGKKLPWLKLYTSLLDNDEFALLDDASRVLIIALWMYAMRTGQHVFPDDAKWLHRKIPMLNSEPDLQPLLDAVDIYGNPRPWVQYCDPPKPKTPRSRKPVKTDAEKKQGEESRVEESRGEQTTVARRGELSGRRERREEEKRRVGPDSETRSDQSQSQSTAAQSTADPTPADPTKPDALGQRKATQVAEPAPGSDNQPQARQRRHRGIYVAGYDRHDLTLGRRVFIALRLGGDPDHGDGYSEVCSFAAVWHRIMQQLARAPPEVRDELGRRAIREAETIAKRRSARSKSKVWISNVRKIAAKRASGH